MSNPQERGAQAYFSDSFVTLTELLTKARQHVISCVSAACPPDWFRLLLACRRRGLAVTLIVPALEDKRSSGLAWERLTALGGELVWLAAHDARIKTSACVIDQAILVSGNFSPVERTGATEFSGIVVQQQTPAVTDCLRGLIGLLSAQTGAGAPIGCCDPLHSWLAIQEPTHQVAPWQLGLLFEQALALDLEIADMHRRVNTFDRQQDRSIGGLMRDFLDFKQRYLSQRHQQFGGEQSGEQARAAQADFAQFEQAHANQEQAPAGAALDSGQQEEIKLLYRRLAMLCHPDRVDESLKPQAQTLFQRLQTGYHNSDFSALQQLEAQLSLTPVNPRVNSAFSSIGAERQLTQVLDQLSRGQLTRRQILESPTWRTLSSQSDWGLWFTQQARYLEDEIERYRQALEPQPPA